MKSVIIIANQLESIKKSLVHVDGKLSKKEREEYHKNIEWVVDRLESEVRPWRELVDEREN